MQNLLCWIRIRWQTWQSKNIPFLCTEKLVDWIFWRKRIQNHGSLAVCFGSLFAVWSGLLCLSEQREQLCTHQKSSCFYQQFHWQPHIQTKSTVTNRWCSILRMWVFLSYFIFFHLGFICPKIFSRTFLKQVLLQVFFGKCHLSLKPVVCVVKLLCSWGRLIYPEQW